MFLHVNLSLLEYLQVRLALVNINWWDSFFVCFGTLHQLACDLQSQRVVFLCLSLWFVEILSGWLVIFTGWRSCAVLLSLKPMPLACIQSYTDCQPCLVSSLDAVTDACHFGFVKNVNMAFIWYEIESNWWNTGLMEHRLHYASTYSMALPLSLLLFGVAQAARLLGFEGVLVAVYRLVTKKSLLLILMGHKESC